MPLDDDEIARFLAGRRNAVLGVNRAGGPPHLTPVWFLWDGRTFNISSTRPRQKVVSLGRDRRVTLCIDDTLGFRSVVVQGTAEVMEDDIWATTREIVERYVDKPFVPKLMTRLQAEPRVLLRVQPEKWLSWDIIEKVLVTQ